MRLTSWGSDVTPSAMGRYVRLRRHAQSSLECADRDAEFQGRASTVAAVSGNHGLDVQPFPLGERQAPRRGQRPFVVLSSAIDAAVSILPVQMR